MFLATLVAAAIFCLPPVLGLGSCSVSSPAQNGQNSSQTAAPEQPSPNQPSPKVPSKSCPESQPGSAAKSDCKAASSGKSKTKQQSQNQAKSSDKAPSKTVIRNGGAGEPDVAFSSGESQQQASRVQETHRLLAAADNNLKDVAVRGLSPSQQVTVKQIRSYMDQAKAAENSGDVERAYNLANKANMLAADLNGH